MLPAEHRLRQRAEFTLAVRRGRRAAAKSMVAHLLVPSASTSEPPRVGIVVSRAVGNAVVRNRVRRRLRHLSRDRLWRLPPASLLVLRATANSAGRTSSELGSDLDAALAGVTR